MSCLEEHLKRHLGSIEYVVIGLVGILLACQLFVEPIIGLANSGDFTRTMDSVGLKYIGQSSEESRYLFVDRHYKWDRDVHLRIPSSSLILLGLALAGDEALSRDGLFDIRCMGLVCTVAFLLTIALLVRYTRRWSLGRRLVLYALIAFLFTDIGYIAYFNSLFFESASFIFLCAVVATATALSVHGRPDRQGMLLLVGYSVTAALFTTAKIQNTPMAIPLAVLGLRFCWTLAIAGKASARYVRRLGVLLTVGLMMVSLGYFGLYSAVTSETKTMNLKDAVFLEILAHSPEPAKDALALGFSPEVADRPDLARLGRSLPEDVKSELLNRIGFGKIVEFYIIHPSRLIALSVRCAHSVFSMRPGYLGNFEKDTLPKRGMSPESLRQSASIYQKYVPNHDQGYVLPDEYRSNRVAVWSTLKDRFVPKSLGFILTMFLATAAMIGFKRMRYDKRPGDRMLSELHITLLVMAAMQFLTVVIAEGEFEIVKHFFSFNLLCDISFVFVVMYAVHFCTVHNGKRRSTPLFLSMNPFVKISQSTDIDHSREK